MAYEQPGVTVLREFEETESNNQEAELSSGVVGPLYQVMSGVASSVGFNPLESNPQEYAWPSKKIGTLVDLSGTRQGRLDSQRKMLAEFPVSFSLVDPVTGVDYPIDDAYVEAIDQDGFHLTAGAKGNNTRATLSFWSIAINNSVVFYRPFETGTQGFLQVRPGDLFSDGVDAFKVVSRTDARLVTDEPIVGVSAFTSIESDGTQSVDITPAASPGRIVISLATSDFEAEEPDSIVGTPVVSYAPKQGFSSITGALMAGLVRANTLSVTVAFNPATLIGCVAKVVNATEATIDWVRVVDYDPSTLQIEFSAAVGANPADALTITVYDAIEGYIESFNALKTQATVVVARTFATNATSVDLYPTTSQLTDVDFWPDFGVKATYRALRRDLVGQAYQVRNLTEIRAVTGDDAVNRYSGLSFGTALTQRFQGSDRPVWMVPVDIWFDDETGLPQNLNLVEGYEQALDLAKNVDIYALVCMDTDNDQVNGLYQAHIALCNTGSEQAERYGYYFTDVPVGDVMSKGGVIEPGKTLTGTASSVTDGNKLIFDPGVNFVTEAGVGAGTRVVVTFPPELAGSYIATGDTTDGVLVLDGAPWSFVRYGERAAAGLTIATSGGLHTLSGAAAGHWRDVEPGDYLHVVINAVAYRLRVVSVPGNASSLVCVDEVAGEPSFTGGSLTGNVFVVRSWGSEGNPPNVQYYIRPINKSAQVAKLVGSKVVASQFASYMIKQNPTMVVGTDEAGQDVSAELDHTLTACAIAGMRSGRSSFQDLTGETFGPMISAMKYAYAYFSKSQLNTLAENGFTLMVQDLQSQPPYIRDLVTSRPGGYVTSQEMVIANSAWQAKTLRARFTRPVGQVPANNTERLRGIRRFALEATLEEWRLQRRLIDYRDVSVEVDPNNPTKNKLKYRGTFPVAEKVIEILMFIET